MRVTLGLALTGASLAQFAVGSFFEPGFSPLSRRQTVAAGTLTIDNTCGITGGGTAGYTCDPTLPLGGTCCSAGGYCGNSTAYCGTGCQEAYGNCSSATTTATTPPNTYQCGPAFSDLTCGNGLCCSSSGYCGNTTDYCGTGCQTAFGSCVASTVVAPLSNGTIFSTDGSCGPTNGGTTCPNGGCCSPAGWCGTTEAYCADPQCQYQYGICDSNTTPAGPTTANDPRPNLGSVSYSGDLYSCTQPNVVALTFDDGPYTYTEDMLDILKQYGFTATFFVTGNNLGKGPIDTTAPWPSLIQRMINEGHQVASHTWSHYNLSALTQAQRIQQMVKNERAIANIIGKYPTYMRPPFSECSVVSGCPSDMQALGYHRTYFDLDTSDYLNNSPDLIQNSKNIVLSALSTASVNNDWLSIQHDLDDQSVNNLSLYYYSLIQSKGLRGVTVGECLADPQQNWYRVPGTGQAAPVSNNTSASNSTGGSSAAATATSTTAGSSTVASTIKTLPSVSSVASTVVGVVTSVGSVVIGGKTTTTTAVVTTTSVVGGASGKGVSGTTVPLTTSSSATSSTSRPLSSVLASTTFTPTSTSRSTSAIPTLSGQTPLPSPTGSCVVSGGSFCGTINDFSDKPSCLAASKSCITNSWYCLPQAGSIRTCTAYTKTCYRVLNFCNTCSGSGKRACTLSNFLTLNKRADPVNTAVVALSSPSAPAPVKTTSTTSVAPTTTSKAPTTTTSAATATTSAAATSATNSFTSWYNAILQLLASLGFKF